MTMQRAEIQETRAGWVRFLKQTLDTARDIDVMDTICLVGEVRMLLQDMEDSDQAAREEAQHQSICVRHDKVKTP